MIEINSITGLPKLFNLSNDTIMNNTLTKNAGKVNPTTLIILIVTILLYYALFKSLAPQNPTGSPDMFGGITESPPESSGLKLIEVFMWGVFLFLVLVNGIQYFFNVDIKAVVKNLFSPIPEIDLSVISNSIKDFSNNDIEEEEEPVKPGIAEVFHISKNKYSYDDAKAICKSYNSKLATYDQIEKAYKKGAEWCSYGWSDNQMTLFPTQKKTWNKLQGIEDHENDCGRPGINGGYIDNTNVKYGVNCYGVKPKSRPVERKIMDAHNILPRTKKEKEFNEKVRGFKAGKPSVLLSPFNYDKWSK